jgi:hypothetical protein
MLLNDSVILNTKYNYDIEYYKSKGYDTSGLTFSVSIGDLLIKSFATVSVSCDYCENIVDISYYKYNRSMKSDIKKYACSKDCVSEKRKESNLLKYGVNTVSKLKTSKEKRKRTNLEKYGFENHTQSKLIKDKIKKTNLEKFGFENPMMSTEVKEKQINTIKNKWGVDNISKLDEIKDKKKQTTLSNYCVEHPLKS